MTPKPEKTPLSLLHQTKSTKTINFTTMDQQWWFGLPASFTESSAVRKVVSV